MSTLSGRNIDRLLHSLFACVLFLTVLFLWQLSYAGSCVALALPGLAFLAIFHGLLEYRLERKRFSVDYYLDRASPLHGWLRRTGLSAPIALVVALPLAAFLSVFAARSRPTDWYFLFAAATAAPLLHHALGGWPGRHFRSGDGDARRPVLADILVARLAGTLLLAGVVAAYVYAGYYVITVPEGIFPESMERTVEAFSVRARSACPIVQNTLLIAAQLDGLSWYFVTTAATSTWLHDGIRPVVWAAFLLNAAMVFAGFVRGLEGSILLACRFGRYGRDE